MWLNLNIDEDGEQFHEVEVPETPDNFGIFAFRSYSFTSLMILRSLSRNLTFVH